jgi:hypothetical protein
MNINRNDALEYVASLPIKRGRPFRFRLSSGCSGEKPALIVSRYIPFIDGHEVESAIIGVVLQIPIPRRYRSPSLRVQSVPTRPKGG